ncbi:hypothetical protein Tco_0653492 [Tanacetum coccineum]|uniref:Uncharacterized protein n=1 Tax=Tanacetum coccineum TaxID=301880 RepID=A0ABQ4X0J1_9ASTR
MVSNLPLWPLSRYQNGCPTIYSHVDNSLVVVALRSAWPSMVQLALVAESERVDVEWEELSFNDWDDMKVDDGENPEESGEDKTNTILEVALGKLDEAWFDGTNEDEGDLEGIIDYLEPKSYDGFIDLDDEAYKERKYTIGSGEIYTKIKVLGIEEVPRTRDNVATIRAGVMKEMGEEGGTQGETGYEFSQDTLVKSSSIAIIIQSTKIMQALEQETRNLDVENKRKKNLKSLETLEADAYKPSQINHHVGRHSRHQADEPVNVEK